MNVYKISKVMTEDDVIYDSSVICADTEEEALKLYPYLQHSKPIIRIGSNNSVLTYENKTNIKIELIGKADDDIKERNILTNCNVSCKRRK